MPIHSTLGQTNNHPMKNVPNDTNFHIAQRVEISDYTSLWQKKLQECITDINELFDILDLPHHLKPGALTANKAFALKVPLRYLSLIEKGNPDDPLLRQILPLAEENTIVKGYSTDPLQEVSHMKSPGIIQKYQGRALLTLTGACAVNCRYCFRRHFPYSEANPANKQWEQTFKQIQKDSSLTEIILSGGDPLLLSDTKLEKLLSQLETVEHITTLRIHTRVPIFLPERITQMLVDLLQNTRFNVVMVVHCNHARELDHDVKACLLNLKATGVTLLNQSVLLKGVNDNLETLKELSQTLFTVGVLPYYLHALDKVAGTAHFDVNENNAKSLYQDLLASLPGYLVPRFVREIPGQPNKTPIAS